jgi:protein-disulfide isomerase
MSTRAHPAIPDNVAVPAHATPSGDGIVVGSGPVPIDAFIDFLCPFCRQFEERSEGLLKRLVDEYIVTIAYHPLGFLDRLSVPGGYSTRAAGAAAAASDADMFVPYKDALFANQPEEGGPGLDDEELVELGRSVGIDDPRFADAVFSGAYHPWVRFVTELAVERGVGGTPTVLVGGIPVPANPQTIAAAVADLAP